jgi:hypothetical protein
VLDVPLGTAFCKTFLLRILNDSWAGRNPTRAVLPIEEEEEEGVKNQ